MARILITSGPTRQFLDPVRFLTNASSGRMGRALAKATMRLGHEAVVVTGPVEIEYPDGSKVIQITSTDELLEASRREFSSCDGLIGAAAPCDYRPVKVQQQKISKTGRPLVVELVETADVVATLGAEKRTGQWVVGFALETDDQRFRALAKLEKKSCDLMVLNGPQAMNSSQNQVELMAPQGDVIASIRGSKEDVAVRILQIIQQRLIEPRQARP